MLKALHRTNDLLTKTENGIAFVAILVSIISTVMMVVWRSILKLSLPWAEEVVRLCMQFAIWLIVPQCMIKCDFVCITLIDSLIERQKKSEKLMRIFTIANQIFAVLFFCAMAYIYWRYWAVHIFPGAQRTVSLEIPLWIPMMGPFIGFVLCIFHGAYSIICRFANRNPLTLAAINEGGAKK